ncbi:MAG: hypothetical protein M9941_10500 [Anaerolineae bacterium]|nr:hypothetical protein [Anaerolineae bacterium]MCO5198157.1 hypothetical protein [Anaerolineae bacterium]
MNRQTATAAVGNSNRLYIILGLLWLGLAAVILFSEFRRPATIVIEWETETEFDTAGFNIYRSVVTDNDCKAIDASNYDQINDELIPSSADPSSGATYSFEDKNVESGLQYCYALEDVEFGQRTERHPPFQGEVQQVQWLALLIAAISVVIGLALLVSGLKREVT